ncbi:MAG: hypothetical protein CBC13_11385 [Planctomycetia bacterium TMED53]|nr:MAG: hypothetical protein CBC13_11385 [Planctomycetia bacterium TMED53]
MTDQFSKGADHATDLQRKKGLMGETKETLESTDSAFGFSPRTLIRIILRGGAEATALGRTVPEV